VPLTLDVTDPATIAAAAERARDVEIVVNTAGIGRPATPLGAALDDAHAELETNYLGLVAVTQAFAPILAANGGGAIVNMLSVSPGSACRAWPPTRHPGAAAWASTNAALDAVQAGVPEALVDDFTRSIKAALAEDQSRIYPAICDQFLAGTAA
jgi:NAD(P)-dependent dehydrogenase (short-subunit alcohol dehydrogenase family)